MTKVIEECDRLKDLVEKRRKDLLESNEKRMSAVGSAQSAAMIAIKYRNQRDELDRQLFLAERMVGSIVCQASSKVHDIEIAARPSIEDEPDTRHFLNDMANGGRNQNECQQGLTGVTVNAVHVKKDDE